MDRLLSFCQVVEDGSIAAASKARGKSEGQYSRQIKDLEEVLETKLFVREGRFLKLTSDGVKLSLLTQSYFSGLTELRDGPHGIGKPLRLGAPESTIRWFLAPRFLEVTSATAGALDIRTLQSKSVVQKIEAGELDLGIFHADDATIELETFRFGLATFVLMVPRTLLPEKSASGIKGVKELPFVALLDDERFTRDVAKVISENALQVRIVARVESLSLAVDLSKNLETAVVVPAFVQGEFPADSFALVPLDGMESLSRPMAVGVSKRTALLSGRSRKAAVKLSRIFDATK